MNTYTSSSQNTAPGARMPPRMSSYASVAAGTAAASLYSHSPNAPVRSGVFSGLMNTNPPSYSHDSDHRTSQHSQGHGGISNGGANIPNSWGQTESLPSYSNHFSFGGGYGALSSAPMGFLKPSYLRGTKYIEKLEASHRAKLAAHKEAAAPVYNSNAGSLSTSSSSVSLHRMAPSHRGMTYEIVENQLIAEDDVMPPLPSRWTETDAHGELEIGPDGTSIRYIGHMKSQHDHEAAAARTDHPMPSQSGIYYYEVEIITKGKDAPIALGFCTSKFSLEKLPGWQVDSWAYHGDDGKAFSGNHSNGKDYGPKIKATDIIGCGVNFHTGCAFFTSNGVFLGTAFREVKGVKIYPSIGMRRPGAHVRVNFGQSPFVFDIDGMMAREKANVKESINSINLTSFYPSMSEDALIKELVSQFLRHDGYVETAKAFAEEVRREASTLKSDSLSRIDSHNVQEDIDATNRQKIRAAVLDGDIDKALKRTHASYPYVLQANPRIYFRLRCRKFVEMMRQCTELINGSPERRGKGVNGHTDDVFEQAMELDDPVSAGDDWDRMETEEVDNGLKYQDQMDETLRYAQELKSEYKDDHSKEVKETLQDIFSLFAYQDPRRSPTAHLLDQSGRLPVAEELNSAILVSLGKPSSAAIERLCQQAEVLVNEISDQGGPGSFINIEHDYLR